MIAYQNLTPNQNHVLALLLEEKKALSAYTILDRLRNIGFRAPLQVYRALEKLVDMGLVHRLESMNAFIACSHPQCEGQGIVAFAICKTCDHVTEFADDVIADNVNQRMKAIHFRTLGTTLEIRGICPACQKRL